LEPNFEALSFEEAVRLFKEWGYLVEPGRWPEEVTLVIDGGGHRSYHVHKAAELPQLAAAILRVRWRNGAILVPYCTVYEKFG
jgi:hypothetical protein